MLIHQTALLTEVQVESPSLSIASRSGWVIFLM